MAGGEGLAAEGPRREPAEATGPHLPHEPARRRRGRPLGAHPAPEDGPALVDLRARPEREAPRGPCRLGGDVPAGGRPVVADALPAERLGLQVPRAAGGGAPLGGAHRGAAGRDAAVAEPAHQGDDRGPEGHRPRVGLQRRRTRRGGDGAGDDRSAAADGEARRRPGRAPRDGRAARARFHSALRRGAGVRAVRRAGPTGRRRCGAAPSGRAPTPAQAHRHRGPPRQGGAGRPTRVRVAGTPRGEHARRRVVRLGLAEALLEARHRQAGAAARAPPPPPPPQALRRRGAGGLVRRNPVAHRQRRTGRRPRAPGRNAVGVRPRRRSPVGVVDPRQGGAGPHLPPRRRAAGSEEGG